MRDVFIVLTGLHVGGTEKRFIELWDRMQEKGHHQIRLVVSRPLFERLKDLPYLTHFHADNANLRVLRARRERDLYPQLLQLVWNAPPGTLFHYPLGGIPFVHRVLGHRVVKSYTHSSYFGGLHRRLKIRLLFWAVAALADRLDILNPQVFARFSRHPLVGRRARTGGGSFVDLEAIRPHSEKRNAIVFLGRLTEGDEKNVLPFLAALPVLHERIRKAGHDVEYYILGHGALESQVRERLAEESYRHLPVTFRFHPNPVEVLQHARVFVSLQKSSNYPSKSLLEAIACGAQPVVTDVGDTRRIATEDFAYFIPGDFGVDDLYRGVLSILEQPETEYLDRVRKGREFVLRHFSVESQIRYYLDLYEV